MKDLSKYYEVHSLLTYDNAKTSKGEKLGYLTGILYLAPASQNSYKVNVCPFSTKECREACLFTAGRGRFNSVQAARIRKTDYYISQRAQFMAHLQRDIERGAKKAARLGLSFAVRLNGTSDLDFMEIITANKEIQFYDYTKNAARALGSLPANYHLTLSYTGLNWVECVQALRNGVNVAAVFNTGGASLPTTWKGYKVISGDDSDLRFADPKGCIVGLKAKGAAINQTGRFVINI